MLKKITKRFVKNFPVLSVFPRFAQQAFLRKSLTIINYHVIADNPDGIFDWCTVQQTEFVKQLIYLKKYFTILPLKEALQKLKGNALTSPTIAITFDDGYQNNFDTAFPILNELQVPATIFLSTRFTDTYDLLWHYRLNEAIQLSEKKVLRWQGVSFPIKQISEKTQTYKLLQHQLKKYHHYQLLHELKFIISKLSDTETMPRNPLFRMLDSASIKTMQNSGLIAFGAHTHSHTILSLLSENEQELEIVQSLNKVQELTGSKCDMFAFPNGRKQDYTQTTLNLLRQNGVEYAVTMTSGFNLKASPKLELRRIGVGGSWDMGLFQFAVHSGLSSFF